MLRKLSYWYDEAPQRSWKIIRPQLAAADRYVEMIVETGLAKRCRTPSIVHAVPTRSVLVCGTVGRRTRGDLVGDTVQIVPSVYRTSEDGQLPYRGAERLQCTWPEINCSETPRLRLVPDRRWPLIARERHCNIYEFLWTMRLLIHLMRAIRVNDELRYATR